MNIEAILGHTVFIWIVLPLFIFAARILDVSLGTMRIVFVSRGVKYLAPLVGFFEVIIWLIAIRQIMQNLNNWACYVAYGAGFAVGNFIGMYLEKRLAVGTVIVRVITSKDSTSLIEHMKEEDFGVTSVEAQGNRGKVHIIFMVVRRVDLASIMEIIKKFDSKAFYSIEDIREVKKGIFPVGKTRFNNVPISPFKYFRKGK